MYQAFAITGIIGSQNYVSEETLEIILKTLEVWQV